MVKTFKLFKNVLIAALIALPGIISVQAQSPISLDNLSIQVWPEFDRPETLVIYKGALADSVALPATLTFRLPAQVPEMFAVAAFDEEQNTLVNNPYTFEAGTLTLTVERRQFQFEYYDPTLVIKADTQRNVQLDFAVDYPVAAWRLELQQPLGAGNLQLSPEADEVTQGADQLLYHIYRRADTTGGETISVSGSYQKNGDTLTAEANVNIPPLAQNTEPAVTPAANSNWLTAGYVLIGLGVLVLLAAGGVWFYRYLNASTGQPVRRPARSRAQVQSKKAGRPVKRSAAPAPRQAGPQDPGPGRFCHQCGTEYKPDAAFCHSCGTPRR